MNFTYLLRCVDNTYYCGWTNHLEKRIQAHNAGTGAKYTRSRRPVSLVYCEAYETRTEAMKREAAIKKMSRKAKEALIRSTPCVVPEGQRPLSGDKTVHHDIMA